MTALLDAHGLSYSFASTGRGIREISFSVFPTSRIALMGANGSGKTTLFLALNGSLRLQGGSIALGGEKVSYDRLSLRRWRSDIGLVLQDPAAQLVGGSVAEDVALGPKNLRLSRDEVEERVSAALEAMGLLELRHRSVHELSFGQKKRAAIAGLLAMCPKVLLLDEPTAGLDAPGAADLVATLDDLHRKGIGLVVSTHDSEFAASWANEVLIMAEGRLMARGTPESAFSAMTHLGVAGVSSPRLLEAWNALPARFRKDETPNWKTVLSAFGEMGKG